MRKTNDFTQKDFYGLLGLLSSDEQEAAKKYEQIRAGLIRFFQYRGCLDAEGLADEAFNRVAVKISTVETDKNFQFLNYFYSFANKIYLEDLKKRKRLVSVYDELDKLPTNDSLECEETSPDMSCMESCLQKQPPQERMLLLKYYSFGKQERVEQRKKLADREKISIYLLHTKIARLRKPLRECLKKCLSENKL